MIGWWGIAALTLLDVVLWGVAYGDRRPSVADRRLWNHVSHHRHVARAMRVPPTARLWRPVVQGITVCLRRIASVTRRRQEAELLMRAGVDWDPALLDGVKFAGALAGILVVALGRSLGVLPGGFMGWALIAGGGGYLAPVIWVRRRARERAREFQSALPDALDVMAICLRGGLGFQAAVAEYAGNAPGVAREAFRRYLADLALGQTPEAGFAEMARRYPGDDLAAVSAGLVQGIRLGSPLADVLEAQASHFRVLALRRAEEAARALTTRLVLPLVAFIFPQVFIIGLGPVALRLLGPGGLLR